MNGNLSDELTDILNDLEQIGEIIAQKEAELGIARFVSIVRRGAGCFELTIGDRQFFLDQAQFEILLAQITLIAQENNSENSDENSSENISEK